MIIIDEILIEQPVVGRKFTCNLEVCKGACCWDGDFGAPLDDDELVIIEKLMPLLLELLDDESRNILKKHISKYYPDINKMGTPLKEDGSCAYLIRNGDVAKCSIEVIYDQGLTDFQKPISCHLYPLRIEEKPSNGFSLMRYDEWEICKSACQLGEELDTTVYEFLKDALVRKYGQEFYDQLDYIAKRKEP